MKPKLENWTIVVLGFWNRMIFQPKWVGEEVFETHGQLETLVSFNPVSPLIYRNEELSVEISEQRLVIGARKPTEECIAKAEHLACRVLDALPKTPVSAIGVNFGFIRAFPDAELLELFNLKDEIRLGSTDWKIQSRRIARQLRQEERVLNLSLVYAPEKTDSDEPQMRVLIEANFDFAVNSAVQAVEHIKGKSVEMYRCLLGLLHQVYELAVQKEESDA